MTQEQKDLQLGRTIREIADHEREIVQPLVKMRGTVARLRSLADTLDLAYDSMLEGHRNFSSANISGSTVSSGFDDVVDVAKISAIENEIRHLSRKLTQLYSTRSALQG